MDAVGHDERDRTSVDPARQDGIVRWIRELGFDMNIVGLTSCTGRYAEAIAVAENEGWPPAFSSDGLRTSRSPKWPRLSWSVAGNP